MEFLFWFFGVFCLAYYGVIVCYSGPSTSFAPIWLVLSACLFIIATVVHFYDRFRDRISLRLDGPDCHFCGLCVCGDRHGGQLLFPG